MAPARSHIDVTDEDLRKFAEAFEQAFVEYVQNPDQRVESVEVVVTLAGE